MTETKTRKNPSTAENASSTPAISETDSVNLQFREACERSLRSDVNRLRLYLEDQRTVYVLLDHVQERIMEVYADYRDLVMTIEKKPSESGQGVLSDTSLKELLGEVCGENRA